MKNKLFYGDNLEVLREIKSETVDLCYIDPPFNSKRNYNQIYNNIGKEDRAQAQAFIDTWTWDTDANFALAEIDFHNKKYSLKTVQLIKGLHEVLGKGSLLAYLLSMTQRITEIHRVLKSTGSFYLHCDPTASHYLKLVLDSIFCTQGGDFQNEIVWCYSIGGKSKTKFGRKHDVILFYTKSKDDTHTFNTKGASISRKPNTHMKMGITGDGREYQEKVDKKSGKVYRYYLDEGKIAEDYWIDIESLNREDRERLGYPTQKPEALLERVIKSSSNEGDVVLDAYCGCGTTIAVAQKLNRNWIGIDITYQSISLILKRLSDTHGESIMNNITLWGIPEDIESARALAHKQDDKTRKEFEKWIILTYTNNKAYINEKKGADGGIDGISMIVDRDEKQNQVYEKVLFSVKSDKSLDPKVIRDLFGVMARDKAVMGYLLTLNPMPNLVRSSKEFGTYRNNLMARDYPKIQVISAEEILNGSRFDLPISIDVVKSAERLKAVKETPTLFEQKPS